MTNKEKQKIETKERILDAANRTFKEKGFSGIGVDGLAKEAGVTSGAFYVHFKSKVEAFRASVSSGLKDFHEGINSFKKENGNKWWHEFSKFYMGEKRQCNLNESCGLQSFSSEVGRFDGDTKLLYEEELKKIINTASTDLLNEKDKEKVWANISMLVGGLTIARAVEDKDLADEISRAIENNLHDIKYKKSSSE